MSASGMMHPVEDVAASADRCCLERPASFAKVLPESVDEIGQTIGYWHGRDVFPVNLPCNITAGDEIQRLGSSGNSQGGCNHPGRTRTAL